jgi:hypothetical protein
VNINLHLTDDTQLRAHGFLARGGLFAEVQWTSLSPTASSAKAACGAPPR